MIASLSGTVERIGDGELVLEVSGVGYLIHSTPRVLSGISIGDRIHLNTSQVFREDQVSLFGFLETEEQEVFDLLRSVSGVGPKSALAVLAMLSTQQIAQAVETDSADAFKAVPGIGPKTAKLICLTLTGKLSSNETGSSPSRDGALAGLISLGWSERQASAALAKISVGELTDEQRLKLALQELGRIKS